jgi:MATE family multidrug resistance protein
VTDDQSISQGSNSIEPQLSTRHQRRAEVRNVIAMAIPMVITTSSRAVMDIVDYVMITRLDAAEAQAAILPAQIVMWSYMIIGVGIVSMVNTFASQSLGRKEYRRCSAYAWQSIYIAALFGGISLAVRPLLSTLLASIAHEPAVQAMELAYARVALITAAPTIAAYGLGWFFVGVHRPWVTMWSAVEANVVNAVVSFVLIFGHLGFEPMGIAGAAWGTLAAVCYRFIRLAVTMLGPRAAKMFATRETWHPSWSCMKGLIRIGLPCGCQWLCEVVVWAIFVNVLVGTKFGTVHLIATNIAWQFMRLAFLPTMGVGQALTSLVGKSIGAGLPNRALREARIATLITLAYMGALSIVYWFYGPALISLFNDDPEVVDLGAKVMKCAAVFQLFDAIGIAYNSALRGAGDTFIPSLFFIVSNWVIIVGCGWIVATQFPQLGSIGPWLAASGLIVIAGVFLWWRWHSKAWMKLNLFDGVRKSVTPVDHPTENKNANFEASL